MDDNQFDKIVGVKIEEEIKKSYINYAMSVIVARALPDVRDGLKPVHRRILFAMSELNLEPSKPYRKSARIVGDTMGKYHPHGDSSIYDAMVRMAQDFSTRYLLVDGHGNFGSVDGDGAAAQRYTEARLTRISTEMLMDIDKDTVDFIPNFDETMKEPTVLPSRFPNLLVNGSSGIAVGMATNIPPHNLVETINAVIKIIDNFVNENRDTDIEELISIVKGPDFPTGGCIVGKSGIKQAYRTGRGKVRVRAVANIDVLEKDRECIIVTEIPYQINKAKLIERIAELVKDKKIEGISDIRDESDRNGMRIVIELKRDSNSNVVLNQLYKFSQLEDTFGINMLALVNNEPYVLNLKQMLTFYLEHQKEVVIRLTKFELDKAKKRLHILEGFIIALAPDNIDEVLNIIRTSKNVSEAKERLEQRFTLSAEQSQAIVDMRFRSLTGLEREKIEDELRALTLLVGELMSVLEDENKLFSVIREDLINIRSKYGDERRTSFISDTGEIDIEDLIEEEASVITMTHLNYIKRMPLNIYKSQNRGGKGIIGMQTREEDIVKNLFVCSTHDILLFFTNFGRVYRTKGFKIPEAGRNARGMALVNLLELSPGENITAVIPVKSDIDDGSYLFMTTKLGIVKKISVKAFKNIRKGGMVAINFRPDDELISVCETDGNKNIFIATKLGKAIMFNENDVRAVGRTAFGVRAIKLISNDSVVASDVIDEGTKVLTVTANGFGKSTEATAYSLQARGGKGSKNYKITDKTGNIVGVNMINENDELMLITNDGTIIRLRAREISTVGRVAQGVKLMNLDDGIEVVSVAKIVEDIVPEDTGDIIPQE